MSEPANLAARRRRQPGARLGSNRLGLGVGQCRHRQDRGAGPALLRLLLAGSRPESILCLTYTKTAAAEMQNRLLKELAALGDDAARRLRDKLSADGTGAGGSDSARRASPVRATLEAKGGLKIYTIHGFCERLLQRFPLEADVTPHFKVLDEPRKGSCGAPPSIASWRRAARTATASSAGARQDHRADERGLFPQGRRCAAREAVRA